MSQSEKTDNRESFGTRRAFLFAAIGSAVGLGNIWRFPYTTYDNGGGAFILPYLVALLTAGIPFLFLDVAIGHKYRSSSPLAFRRMHSRNSETLGWWHVLVNAVICVYYAVVFTWAVVYTFFAFNKKWGDNPTNFFVSDFLKLGDLSNGLSLEFVGIVAVPLLVLWVATLFTIEKGVRRGISVASNILMPILLVMFVALVVYSLFLPGAAKGLEALFTPNWEKLADPKVWTTAYGQVFFSLSIGFGIMITYASYLPRKTDLTGTSFVVAFANSAFEMLAAIGVFAALGFMALSAGSEVQDVAKAGIGLAFFTYPTILNNAPFGEIVGVLFFGSLSFAAFTSLISLVETIVAAVQEKFSLTRLKATVYTGVPLTLVSVACFATTTGLFTLDTTDKFVNTFGILASAVVVLFFLMFNKKLPVLREHLNKTSSFKVGKSWEYLLSLAAVVLAAMLVMDTVDLVKNGYEGYPDWLTGSFGWAMSVALVVVAFLVTRKPWRKELEEFKEEE